MLRKNAAKFLSTLLFLGGTIFTGLNHVNAVGESQANLILHFVSPYSPNRAVDYHLMDDGRIVRAVVYDNGNFTGAINFAPPFGASEAAERVDYNFPIRPVTPSEVELPERTSGM